MIIALQILGILFGLFMLYYSHLQFRKKSFSSKDFAIWVIIWIVFIISVAFPTYLSILRDALLLERRLDLLFIISSLFVIGLTFNNFVRLKKNQRQLETAVRALAINEKKNR